MLTKATLMKNLDMSNRTALKKLGYDYLKTKDVYFIEDPELNLDLIKQCGFFDSYIELSPSTQQEILDAIEKDEKIFKNCGHYEDVFSFPVGDNLLVREFWGKRFKTDKIMWAEGYKFRVRLYKITPEKDEINIKNSYANCKLVDFGSFYAVYEIDKEKLK